MIPQTGRNFLSSQVKRLLGEKPTTPAPASGMPDQLRDYGVGAQILADLGVQDMELLSNSSHELVGLDAYGLRITGQRAVPLG
jgi:3,4-dihydroxy 2-butanone 4-phosphate synthase/GTP cyclohydrolase II